MKRVLILGGTGDVVHLATRVSNLQDIEPNLNASSSLKFVPPGTITFNLCDFTEVRGEIEMLG